MCGSPDIDTSYQDFAISEAGRARAEEDARQIRIDEGLRQIEAVFDGGEYAALNKDPRVVNTNGGKAGDNKYANDKWVVRNPQGRGEATLYEGMNPILAQRETAMRDYYFPQIDDARKDAADELTFALARAGLLNSSTAGERQADLTEQHALERGSTLAKIAADQANTKSRMNQQRSAIEAGLRATGDTSAAAQQALSSAVTFREDMPELSPVGALFASIAEGIGSYQQGYRAGEIRRAATPSPLTGPGSGRVVS